MLQANRPITRVLFAAAFLVFATVVAPACALMLACPMPCCKGNAAPMAPSVTAGGCAEHCGLRDVKAETHALPDAVAPSSAQITIASLAIADGVDTIALPDSPPLPAFSVESHHAIPGDAPLYLYNSVFLI